jgi:antitoxin VapB
MALNIKNTDVEKLLDELTQVTGESKTEAVRKALVERKGRLALRLSGRQREIRLRVFLQDEVWPQIPEALRGVRLSKAEEEAILGYGEQGI